jgi:hypothetical protein
MTLDTAVEFAEMGLSLLKTQTSGNVQQGVVVADILLNMAVKVRNAYKDETGRPLDLSLIRPEPETGQT